MAAFRSEISKAGRQFSAPIETFLASAQSVGRWRYLRIPVIGSDGKILRGKVGGLAAIKLSRAESLNCELGIPISDFVTHEREAP